MCDIEYINELFEKAEMEEEGYEYDWVETDDYHQPYVAERQDVHTPWAMEAGWPTLTL